MFFINPPFGFSIAKVALINLCFYIILCFSPLQELKIGIYLISFLVWVLILRRANDFCLKTSLMIFVPVVVFTFCSNPFYENDYYRYFIDALHLDREIPVYAEVPKNSSIILEFKNIFGEADYLDYGSIYPIISLNFFQFVLRISGESLSVFVRILQSMALCLSLFCFFLIGRKREVSRPAAFALIVASCPLFVLEWYQNLHFDFLLSICLMGVFYSSSCFLRTLFLSLGLHVKYVIVVLIGFVDLKNIKWIRAFVYFGVCNTLILLLYPSIEELEALIRNIFVFGREWEMNSGLFRLERSFFQYILPLKNSISLSFYFNLIILAGVFLYLKFKANFFDLEHRLWLFFQVLILCSPIVNPWYMTWALPFLLFSKRTNYYFLLSIAPIFLSYSFYLTQNYLFWFNIEHIIMWLLIVFGVRQEYLNKIVRKRSEY